MRVLAAIAVVLGVATAMAGCSSQPPLPQDHYYRLQVGQPAQVFGKPPLVGILEIDRFDADGLVASRPVVYSQEGRPNILKAYHYHFWTEPPPLQLRDQLVGYLRAARAASTVVTPAVRTEPDFFITGKVKRFERVLGSTPRASFEVELALRAAAGGRILVLGTYRSEAEAASDGFGDTISAFDEVVTQAFNRFLADISKI